MSLSSLLDHHEVVICVGSGGVGKTTTAAALAVHAASRGQRVLCLTIDPARRLANSLGLSEMRTTEQEVPASLFERHGLTLDGELSAMMLDTKRTFDELVERYASSPEVRDRILKNELYQYISTSLAGTQEYMAMEKLHAVRQAGQWDLIVLDTPPTTNALDFLDAPERMVNAIDSPAMRWFMEVFEDAGKKSFGVLGRGAAFLMRGLARFTGVGFLEQVAEFVVDLNDLFGGFRERATEVASTLRGEEVAFVIVTDPRPMTVREALFFSRRLEDAGIRRDAFVVNSVHPELPSPDASREELTRALEALLPASMDAGLTLERLEQALRDERTQARSDATQTKRLKAQVGQETAYVEVPAFEEDVHDLGALAQVAAYLVGTRHITDAARPSPSSPSSPSSG
jgi:anion-transporting  ArsA/GET3 family ATPase